MTEDERRQDFIARGLSGAITDAELTEYEQSSLHEFRRRPIGGADALLALQTVSETERAPTELTQAATDARARALAALNAPRQAFPGCPPDDGESA